MKQIEKADDMSLINWKGVQRKNVDRSSLRASWQNGPYTNKHLEQNRQLPLLTVLSCGSGDPLRPWLAVRVLGNQAKLVLCVGHQVLSSVCEGRRWTKYAVEKCVFFYITVEPRCLEVPGLTIPARAIRISKHPKKVFWMFLLKYKLS